MLKYLNNNRGIALLTVMAIMTTLVLVGSLLLYMASSESRVVYNYSNNNRAYYVAEAGADLAIKEWKKYIIGLPVVNDQYGNLVLTTDANIADFINQLENAPGNPKGDLERKIRNGYGFDENNLSVGISLDFKPAGGGLNPVDWLYLTVTGEYDGVTCEQKVQLSYDSNKQIFSHKGKEPVPISAVPVAGVTLNPTGLTLVAGGATAVLTATVLPVTASNKKLIWSSDNPTVATVVNGVVTPVSPGDAVITVTTIDGNHTATCAVKVKSTAIPVEAVTLDYSTLKMSGPIIFTLTNTIIPADATNKNVTWSSSNPSVATVSGIGINTAGVKALAAGSTIITVKTDDGGHTAICTVTVFEPGEIPDNLTGPSALDNLIVDSPTQGVLGELWINGYVLVENTGILEIRSADILSTGSSFTLRNSGSSTIESVDKIEIGTDMTLENHASVRISNSDTIEIGRDFLLFNSGEVTLSNVGVLIIEGDFSVLNNTNITFDKVPMVIIKGNLTMDNNSTLRVIGGGTTDITLHGTLDIKKPDNFQVDGVGSTLVIHDESVPPVQLYKLQN